MPYSPRQTYYSKQGNLSPATEYILSFAIFPVLLIQLIPIFMISCPFFTYTNYPYNYKAEEAKGYKPAWLGIMVW